MSWEGLARRREAALRLPPLDCGCRDPETIEHREGRCKWRKRGKRNRADDGLSAYQAPDWDDWPDVDRSDPWYLDHLRRLASTPSYAELERLRWDGPRRDFGRPRPGDYLGSWAA